jgi:tetratricopeptide (TPR) repeat protein
MTGIDPAAEKRANPFVGPRPLEKGQRIFGRDREIDQLYYLLSAERVVLFHSPSGAGKSSLLQAGLVPRLTQQFDVWIPARVNLERNSNGREGVNRYVRSCNLGFEAEVPKLLQRDEETISTMTLVEYVDGRPRRRSARKNVVLIFDQFEEVLTVDPLALDAKREFFAQLGKLLQEPHIWAIFAIREDYLAPLDPYAEQLPTHLKNRFRLDLLGRDAAEEAIRKTVEGAGRSFAPEALGRLVADLATMQVQQPGGEFKSEPGPYIEPLHLQVACRNLWERMGAGRAVIEASDIDAFGDVTGALAEYYESEVAKAAGHDESVERSIREWFGEKLITRGTVRGQVLREAGKSGGLDNSLIERLIDTHLVRGEQRAGATWYELAHDRLVEPVLRNNERWLGAHLTNVQRRAREWEREGEPESLLATGGELSAALRWAALPARELTDGERRFLEACRKKRRRVIQIRAAVATLIAFLIVTSGLGVVARRARDRAEENLQLAKKAVDESLSSAGREQARETADSPEIEAFRKELLDKAAPFYAAFTRENSSNPELRAEAAWAHSRLGDVNRLLNRREVAASEYKQAIAGFQSLADQYPNASEYRQALGYCHNWLGETYRVWLEQTEPHDAQIGAEARTEYDSALGLQEQIHAKAPANEQYSQELARSYYNRGILSYDQGDRKGAETDFRTAIGLLEKIGQRPEGQRKAEQGEGSSPSPAQDLARAENNLAALDAMEGRNEESRALYERAIATAKQLISSDKEKREYQAELAQYSDNEARLLADLNDFPGAERLNHQALDLVEGLANPAPSLSIEELEMLELRSEILMAQGSKDALEESERESELLTRLKSGETLERHPLFHVVYRDLAANYVALAGKDLKEGDVEGARLSLKGLALIMPELTSEDRETAQAQYTYLERQLRLKVQRGR